LFGLGGSETFLFVAVSKLRLGIIDNVGCAGFECFFFDHVKFRETGKKELDILWGCGRF
jgi:hypothetical protein